MGESGEQEGYEPKVFLFMQLMMHNNRLSPFKRIHATKNAMCVVRYQCRL